jgi:flagellar M-ring protein FliF
MNLNIAQLGRQLVEIWKRLGLNQRLSVSLAAAAVIAGLGSLIYFSSRVDYAMLYSRLEEADAAKVIAALDDAKIPYRVRGIGTVFVPADKVDVMRIQLASRVKRGDVVGYEIFDKPNFGLSDFAQRVNFLRATKGDLERTISHLDEVESARVTLYVPENRLLIDNKKQATAAVLIHLKGAAQLRPESVKTIRFLVASAVEGLQANQVTVADNHGSVFSEPSDNDSMTGLASGQLASRQNLEQYLSHKAEGMLEKVLGPGQAVVRVSAETDYNTESTTKEEFTEGVLKSKKIKKDVSNSTSANPSNSGVPGITTNTGVGAETNNVTATPATLTRTETEDKTEEYDNPKTTSNLLKGAGALKRVSAAVFIAAKMEGAGVNRKIVPRTPEEIEKLRRLVQSALGIQPTTDRKDEITLEEISFNDQFSTEVTQKFETNEQRQFWWSLARQLIYPALALGILIAFWRAFKRTPTDNIPLGIPLSQFPANGDRGKGNEHGMPDWAPGAPKVVTVEVLNRLVRENPGNMTQAIRGWLTQGNKNQK